MPLEEVLLLVLDHLAGLGAAVGKVRPRDLVDGVTERLADCTERTVTGPARDQGRVPGPSRIEVPAVVGQHCDGQVPPPPIGVREFGDDLAAGLVTGPAAVLRKVGVDRPDEQDSVTWAPAGADVAGPAQRRVRRRVLGYVRILGRAERCCAPVEMLTGARLHADYWPGPAQPRPLPRFKTHATRLPHPHGTGWRGCMGRPVPIVRPRQPAQAEPTDAGCEGVAHLHPTYRRGMPSFDQLIGSCGEAACCEWGYPSLPANWLPAIEQRLPPGLRAAIADAVANGTMLIVDGHRFSLSGLAPSKGPYALFSRSARKVPAPNWEYFVQAAEYVRLAQLVQPRGLRVDFEDDLMDVAVYEGGRVLWCIEVKEKARDLESLLKGMRLEAPHVDLTAPDRHNDPLRKAKYLLRHRPPYFSAVAIGSRLDFSVTYHSDGFVLTEDLVPIG